MHNAAEASVATTPPGASLTTASGCAASNASASRRSRAAEQMNSTAMPAIRTCDQASG